MRPSSLLALSFLLLFNLQLLSVSAQAPTKWIEKSPEDWPIISLTNHMQYQNGDSYIHSSFSYAGTGFLIDTGSDIFAATAKHVLWIAKNKASASVEINEELAHWIMKPKHNQTDSVEIDYLINEDPDEVLEGPGSSITERDWLVFKVKNIAGDIEALKPRYSRLVAGEQVHVLGCPYADNSCNIYSGKFLRQEGMDILLDLDTEANLAGGSGSPGIDANGHLVGILSSITTDPKLNKNIIVGISTEYLKDVLKGKENLNQAKKDYGELLLQTALEKGAAQAVEQYYSLTQDPKNYYVYNLRSSNRNGLAEAGQKLLDMDKIQDAIILLTCNVEVNSHFFRNYNLLAKAHLINKDTELARKYYTLSTEKYGNEAENEAFEELEKILNN